MCPLEFEFSANSWDEKGAESCEWIKQGNKVKNLILIGNNLVTYVSPIHGDWRLRELVKMIYSSDRILGSIVCPEMYIISQKLSRGFVLFLLVCEQKYVENVGRTKKLV